LPKGQAKHYCGSNEQQAEISRQGEGQSQLEEFESPILFLSTGIRRPVRNDVLIDLYAFDPSSWDFPDALYETSHELSHSSKLIPVVAGSATVRRQKRQWGER
jgi:hypothetical protein